MKDFTNLIYSIAHLTMAGTILYLIIQNMH